jgi:hypothetical protein
MTGIADRRAGAARGHVVAALPINEMKSRRRIALTKASDHANYVITAGICDPRNEVQGSFCTAAILSRSCPLWVKSGH